MMGIVDADGAILGRLASRIAKRLLDGESIVIINAEKAVITGRKKDIMDRFRSRRTRGKPRKGPHYPRLPDRILRRSIRGMLPYKRPRGRTAFKNLKVYIGVPRDVDGSKAESYRTKLGTDRFMLLGDVSRELGAKFGGDR